MVLFPLPRSGGGLGRGFFSQVSISMPGVPPLQLSPTRGERAGKGSAYSVHPCASRTLIMAPSTLFQVSCRSITALGNMQPSQQMWRIFLVR